jgi:hypothetical protein
LAVLIGGAITVAAVAGVPSVGSAAAGDDLEVTPLVGLRSSRVHLDDHLAVVGFGFGDFGELENIE